MKDISTLSQAELVRCAQLLEEIVRPGNLDFFGAVEEAQKIMGYTVETQPKQRGQRHHQKRSGMKGHRKPTIAGQARFARRLAPGRDLAPCWSVHYGLGVQASKGLPVFHGYKEIGKALGITKQNAYTETMLALGKVCLALRGLTGEGLTQRAQRAKRKP